MFLAPPPQMKCRSQPSQTFSLLNIFFVATSVFKGLNLFSCMMRIVRINKKISRDEKLTNFSTISAEFETISPSHARLRSFHDLNISALGFTSWGLTVMYGTQIRLGHYYVSKYYVHESLFYIRRNPTLFHSFVHYAERSGSSEVERGRRGNKVYLPQCLYSTPPRRVTQFT